MFVLVANSESTLMQTVRHDQTDEWSVNLSGMLCMIVAVNVSAEKSDSLSTSKTVSMCFVF